MSRKYLFSLRQLRDLNHSFGLKTSWNTVSSRCQFSSFSKIPPPRVYIQMVSDKNSQYTYEISKEQEDLVTKGIPDSKLKMQETLLFMYWKQSRGEELPEALSVEEFRDLMHMSQNDADKWLSICISRRAREKLLRSEKQASKNQLREEKGIARDLSYARHKQLESSLFLDVLKRSRSHFYNTMLGKGLLFGQQLVFDCSYEAHMGEFGLRTTASDIHNCIKSNRKNRRPFSLYFCNVASDCRVMHFLKKRNPFFAHDLPVTSSNASYLDLFERERIVYLSPHVNKELEYHPDDVFILGAISQHKEPLSVKKAQYEGIRCARLPVGFQQWVRGSRVLSIYEVSQVLLSNDNFWGSEGRLQKTFETLLMKKNTGNWIHIRNLNKKKKTTTEVDDLM